MHINLSVMLYESMEVQWGWSPTHNGGFTSDFFPMRVT